MQRAVLGTWVAIALAVAACGKSSRHGASPTGDAGAPDHVAAGGTHGDGVDGSGANAGGTAAGGEAPEAGAPQGGQSVAEGGEPGFPHFEDERFVTIEPTPAPEEFLYDKGGGSRALMELEPTDELTSYPMDLRASDDGTVVVGTWNHIVLRPRTSATLATITHAFRWTEQTGPVPLVDLPDNVKSVPLGMSADGSVVFVKVESFDGLEHVCRWTAADGCQLLEGPGTPVGVISCPALSRRNGCVSRNGQFLALHTDLGQHTSRWSEAAGWEGRQQASALALDDTGAVLLEDQYGVWLWQLGESAVQLATPDGYDGCWAALSQSGTLLAGGCLAGFTPGGFRWQTAEVVEPWSDMYEVSDPAADGQAAVGYGLATHNGGGQHGVVKYWSEADGSVTALDPGPEGYTLGGDFLSLDGKVAFGTFEDNEHLTHWYRWSKADGPNTLDPPAGYSALITNPSADGSITGGQSLPIAGGNPRATLWDHLGPRLLDDVVTELGIALGTFTVEDVFFTSNQGEEVRVLGTGRVSPLGPRPYDESAGRVYVARIPGR